MAVDIAAVLTASITDFKAKMDDAEVKMKTMTASGSGAFSSMASIGKGALMGIGAVVAVVGVAAVDFGNKLEMSQAQLQAALKASGTSWSSVQTSVAQTAAEATKYGFTQAQIDSALTQGVISTQNYASAHRNLTIAIQLAAARHIDLASAMQAVDKAATGQLRPLKMLGIDLPVVASNALKVQQAHDKLAAAQLNVLAVLTQYPGALSTASKHHAAYQKAVDNVAVATDHLSQVQNAHILILNALSQRLGGQAAAAAQTFEGRIAAAKAEATNLVAQLGLKLIPVLVDVMNVTMNVVNWLQKHKTAAEALGIAVGTVLVAAIGAFTASLFMAGGALAFITGPIALIIAAVALVVVGIVLLATHWNQVWSDIKTWTHDAVVWIQNHFAIMMAIPIVGWMLYLAANWRTVWSDIQAVIAVAWSIIGPVFNLIKTAGIDYISASITVFKSVWDAAWTGIQATIQGVQGAIGVISAAIGLQVSAISSVVSAFQAAWNSVWNAVAGVVQAAWAVISPVVTAISNAVGGVANSINTIKGAIGGLISAGGSALSTLTGGLLAEGGPAQANVPYIVGESGPELFIPSASGVVVPHGSFGPGMGAGSAVAAGGGGNVPAIFNLHINGHQFATAMFPDFWTVMLQQKRSVLTLNLT